MDTDPPAISVADQFQVAAYARVADTACTGSIVVIGCDDAGK
jgi:hypothetical protein